MPRLKRIDQPISVDKLMIEIRETALKRRQFLKAQMRLNNQAMAICRGFCEGDKIKGAKLFKMLKDYDEGKLNQADMTTELLNQHLHIHPLLRANAPLASIRTDLEKTLIKLATLHPVYKFAESVHGFGALGLGILIGEIGDLSHYSGPGKVWKRLGLGTIDGSKQWCPRGVSQEETLKIGYNRQRRAASWVIFDSLMRSQSARIDKETGESKRGAGPYRVIYDERKALEALKNPNSSRMALHRRAMRYSEKRFIRDLWVAWNQSETIAA